MLGPLLSVFGTLFQYIAVKLTRKRDLCNAKRALEQLCLKGCVTKFEPPHEKIIISYMRKQRRRSASQLLSLCFRYTDCKIPKFPASSHLLRLYIPDRFVSDLFRNHIVGFLMRRPKYSNPTKNCVTLIQCNTVENSQL